MAGFATVNVVSGGIRVQTQPGGIAAGDLTGSYDGDGPIVDALQRWPIDPRSPANGDTLVFNGGEWIPTPTPTSTATVFKGIWDANTNTPDITSSPSDGDTWLVFIAGNTNVGGISDWNIGDYAVYSGGDWYKLSSNSFGWLLAGNAGTNPTVNYIGTSDPHDLSIRSNAIESLRILSAGGIVITGSTEIVNGNLLISGNVRALTGLSGSHTKLSDGTSAFIGCTGILVATKSNGAVTFTLSNTGSSGTYGSQFQVPIFDTDAQGRITSVSNTSILISESQVTNLVTDIGNITGSITSLSSSLASTINSVSSSLASEKADKTTSINTGLGLVGGGNLSADRTLAINNSIVATISGSTFTGAVKFNSGMSGSLTKLVDGTSYITQGQNISVTSASNGSISVAFSTPFAPTANDVLIYSGSTWTASSIINTLQTSYQTVSASEAIAAGDVVYIVNSGGSAGIPTIARAQANSLSTVHGVLGLATTNIAKNTTGTVQTYGQLIGPVDTHTFGQGDPLYVSAVTPGGVTNVKPAGPNYTFQIGIVTRQGQPQNVTSGIVFVSPIMQTDTQNISDIVVTSPIEHDTLTYDTATSTWKNKQPLWISETQTALTVSAGQTITASDFANVIYLPIKTAGGANVTLNATSPVANLTKTAADYGRELWLHNVDNNRNITIQAGGTVKLDGGVNLILTPGTIVRLLWTGLGGNGAWIQTAKAVTVS